MDCVARGGAGTAGIAEVRNGSRRSVSLSCQLGSRGRVFCVSYCSSSHSSWFFTLTALCVYCWRLQRRKTLRTAFISVKPE